MPVIPVVPVTPVMPGQKRRLHPPRTQGGPHDEFIGRVRTRTPVHSRRSQFSCPSIPGGRRRPDLLRARGGGTAVRHRLEALCRLRRYMGAGGRRSCPPPGGRGSARSSRSRPELRRADDARIGDGRARLQPRPIDGQGTHGELRHRGDDERHPPRPRIHRPRRHREIRGVLPRTRRLSAREGRLRRPHLRSADFARRPPRRSPSTR